MDEAQRMVNFAFSVTGILVSVVSFISILAAQEAVSRTVRKWRTRYDGPEGERCLPRGVRDLIDPIGLLPAIKGAGSRSSIGRRGNVFSFFVPILIGAFWLIVFLVT